MYFGKTSREVGRDQSRRSDGVRIGVVSEMRKSRISKLDQSWRRGKKPSSLGGYGERVTSGVSSGFSK